MNKHSCLEVRRPPTFVPCVEKAVQQEEKNRTPSNEASGDCYLLSTADSFLERDEKSPFLIGKDS
mgnify:CR=1 FL=1